MGEKVTRFSHWLRQLLSSSVFTVVVLSFFVFQALWISFSAAYPQAFDEHFHFGLIKLYSHYSLPFLTHQPPGGNAFGAVARDPSFLYHYILSWPYRLISAITDNQIAQIITLRLINVALFTLALWLFHKLLRGVGLSKALANLCIFFVTFIPIAPQLAGQLNYDNMLLPLTALALLLSLGVLDHIKARRLQILPILSLIAVCLTASLVKYEFLPIFAVIGIYLLVSLLYAYRGQWSKVWGQLLASLQKTSRVSSIAVATLCVLLLGMFVQRDVVNLLKYHDVVPDCGKILSVSECRQYYVWDHDYVEHNNVVNGVTHFNPNPLRYLGEWFYWMWYRSFFVKSGPENSYANYPPLPLPAAAFLVFSLIAVYALIRQWRKLWRSSYLRFFSIIVISYVLVLMVQGYFKYKETAVLELMNGRYLLPIMFVSLAVVGFALQETFHSFTKAKAILAAVLIICFVQGGGVFGFILRSDNSWYWKNQTVQQVNHGTQRVLSPVIIEGSKYYWGSRWWLIR